MLSDFIQFLNRSLPFWPFSEIRRLQRQCHEHWEFGEAVLAALRHFSPGNQFIRFNDELYVVCKDCTVKMERQVRSSAKLSTEYDA